MPAFLFPGQGSQRPGCAHAFARAHADARAVLCLAERLLPDTIIQIMRDGPQESLNDTRCAQPALLCAAITSNAYLQGLGIRPELCAGHSLGEISALVAAGALDFEQALPLVCERARLMSEGLPEGGMAAVIGITPELIEDALPEDAQIANYNGPNQTIISGTKPALITAAGRLKQAGAKRVLPLPVSGPFHSRFMVEASRALAAYLVNVPIRAPHIPFLSSVSGDYERDPDRIRTLLSEQLIRPVRWTTVMLRLSNRTALEAGPGGVLQGLAKRMPGAPKISAADTPEACDLLERML